jgi:hypothetical protein
MNQDPMQIGRKEELAFVIGGYFDYPHLRYVDIWVAGEHLTYHDNAAYLPSFIRSMDSELIELSRDDRFTEFTIACDAQPAAIHLDCMASEVWDRHWLLNFGPTTDGAIVLLFRDAEHYLITFEFSDAVPIAAEQVGKIFSVKIPQATVKETFRQAITMLRSASSQN